MVAQTNLISIDTPKNEFKHFLSIDKNKRIFFSGKFGTGKTFFLQKFFEENSDMYCAFHLSPVRYQISKNENIFELLKYDILVELAKKNPEFLATSENIPSFFAFLKETFTVKKILNYTIDTTQDLLSLSPILSPFSIIGRPLKDILNLDESFQKFKKEQANQSSKLVQEFLSKIARDTGNINMETDPISYLLRIEINKLRQEKKSVLILDDFDRIDPEHIFRILNILSAHMETTEDNKFGFDHIIIVGDIDNIKSIFHHKYGQGADFLGYFDKFFSIKPHIFDNQTAVREALPELLAQIKHEDQMLSLAISNDGGIIKYFLQEVLTQALTFKLLNLRQIYRPIDYSFPEFKVGVYNNSINNDNYNQCIDVSVKLLIALFENEKNFIVIIEKIINEIKHTDATADKVDGYQIFITSMLRHIMTLEPNTRYPWLNKVNFIYVKNSTDSKYGYTVFLDNKKEYLLFFYEVLLRYVSLSKYKKQNTHEYNL
ncbi:MAG TPA: P-loop NTPase fold protein [Candidatus Magasanikbacteria bacterium]|nr:P-loop NTPase fold protein [Candidatus Magasanikbacteria bacterium]